MGTAPHPAPHKAAVAGAPVRRVWGPLWDHTLCAIVNDLRAYERTYTATERPQLRVTWQNVLPQFTGGQVVAGSNPVSPTDVSPT